MPIKAKTSKKTHSDKRLTIDVIHSNLSNTFINSVEEDEYYLDNGDILNEYYSNRKTDQIEKDANKHNILDFFDSNRVDDINQNNIIGKYISNIDDEYIYDSNNADESIIHSCKYCHKNMKFKLVESEIYCENCGFTEEVLINSEKVSYKDVPRELSYFAYKRINHFNEWLAQFQAKETTLVPISVFEDVNYELQKNINLKCGDIKYQTIRDILKSTNNNKYYEHIPLIINVITGKKAPLLILSHEEKLRNMFKEIQLPFMKHCPDNRKNFLSYSYVLHKFCELLELDNLLEYFPLLKSREKLKQQDKIWIDICKELRWQYIPSI